MNFLCRTIRIFLARIMKGLFAFTFPVTVGVQNGVSMFDEEEEDTEAEEKNGICANCGKYDCEC
jgi:hypothetical protein